MVANNWGRESEKLFSLIQRQRKADKFDQYRGGKMEFSEELKQIVRETKGVWLDGSKIVGLAQNGDVMWFRRFGAGGCGAFFERPEFEACLMEMTGRPKVEDWPVWMGSISQSITGSWFAMEQSGARYKLPFYGEFINGENISKEEAIERERIINGTSSSEVEPVEINFSLPDWNSAPQEANFWCPPGFGSDGFWINAFDGVLFSYFSENDDEWKLGEWVSVDQVESLIERPVKTARYRPGKETVAVLAGGSVISSTDKDGWFRLGELPPIGEVVNAHWQTKSGKPFDVRKMSVIGVYDDAGLKRVWLTNEKGNFRTVKASMVFPKGYNLDGLHEEATKENERINSCMRSFLEISELLKKISASGRVSMDAEVIAEYLVDYGCRCHPELAE